jgi:hypothetical protein
MVYVKKRNWPSVATLLLEEWEDDTHTPKMGILEFAGTFETLEFSFRSQNTLHWNVLYIIGKLSKCKCRKWLAQAIWTFAAQVM